MIDLYFCITKITPILGSRETIPNSSGCYRTDTSDEVQVEYSGRQFPHVGHFRATRRWRIFGSIRIRGRIPEIQQ
jgi:hypothetical protein